VEPRRRLNEKLRAERNELILRLKSQGLTPKQISAQVNLTFRGVQQVIYKARKKEEKL